MSNQETLNVNTRRHVFEATYSVWALGWAKSMVCSIIATDLLVDDFSHLWACRKVAIILAELNIPYDWKVLEFNEVKNTSYTKVNPNGRLPAIEDPNTGHHALGGIKSVSHTLKQSGC